jgi:methyltransferase-like protein
MVSTNFSEDIAKTLHELGAHDIIQMEQYMDFVRCRYFRKSLICRSAIKLNRAISPVVVKDLYLASDATPQTDDWSLGPEASVLFSTRAGRQISCKSPLTKLALLRLREVWPATIAFGDLLAHSKAEAIAKGFAVDEAGAEEFLAGDMLTAMGAGLLEWRVNAARFTTQVAEKPVAPPLARLQATQGYKVTNLRGEVVTLDEMHRQALLFLDGSNDVAAIADQLMDSLRSGKLVLHKENDQSPITDEAEMQKLLETALDRVLVNVARKALLSRAN